MEINSVCVFCGSSNGNKEEYVSIAKIVGETLAKKGINLVYGAGNRGLMGLVSSTARRNGSFVSGITPTRFVKSNENAPNIDEYIVVKGMHERKALMYKKSDAFIILPGGIGTLEEFAEAFTWQGLGMLSKPIAILNVDDFYTPLLTFLNSLVDSGFMKKESLDKLIVSDNIEYILSCFEKAERTKGIWEN